MPLKVQLRKGQKIIINGAVLENIANHNVSLLVMNDAAILRDSDILTPEDAATPASRVYYELQCAYLFPQNREVHIAHFQAYMSDYLRAAPSAEALASEIQGMIAVGDLYPALKRAQKLIEHERKVLTHVQERLGQELRGTPRGG
jgi:flagellar protein FlbT